jgi:hypothetical protein
MGGYSDERRCRVEEAGIVIVEVDDDIIEFDSIEPGAANVANVANIANVANVANIANVANVANV